MDFQFRNGFRLLLVEMGWQAQRIEFFFSRSHFDINTFKEKIM